MIELMLAAMLRAFGRWLALKVTGFERRRMDALRRELEQIYEAENVLGNPSADMRPKELSGIYGA